MIARLLIILVVILSASQRPAIAIDATEESIDWRGTISEFEKEKIYLNPRFSVDEFEEYSLTYWDKIAETSIRILRVDSDGNRIDPTLARAISIQAGRKHVLNELGQEHQNL